MDGVTILSENIYRGTSLGFVILTAIIVILVFCAIVYGVYKDCRNLSNLRKRIRIIVADVLLAMALMSIMVLFIGVAFHDYLTIYTDYKVRVDDSISLNEFINNYKIISYDGDTYTVREIKE